MKRDGLILSSLSLGVLLTGCANRLVFTTQTSLGLDVSGTAQVPNKVSLSYNRYEAAIVPRKTNGDAHSVYGGLDADISFIKGSTIQQTFTTGEAAKLATGSGTAPTNSSGTANTDAAPLIFVTGTTFGLHLTAGEQELAPNLLMGYRRSEATVIPVPDAAQEVRPVYADILINTKDNPSLGKTNGTATPITTNFPAVSGTRIKQSFATGTAAINLAKDAGVQETLSKAAGTTANTLARLRVKSAELAKEVSLEVSRLTADQLDKGGEALVGSGLAKASELTKFKGNDAFTKARTLREMAKGLATEAQIKQLEKYLVLLRDIE